MNLFAGDVLEGELELLEQEERNSDTESTQFTCGAHFYEEVEDKKDSVWVVQVRPNKKTSMFLVAHMHCILTAKFAQSIFCLFVCFFLMICVFTNYLGAEKQVCYKIIFPPEHAE